jgi:hypothetical protein
MFINFDKKSLFSENMRWSIDRISLMHRLFYTFDSRKHIHCRKKSKLMSINVSISSFMSKKTIPQKLVGIDFCNFIDSQNSFLKLRQNRSISENFISSYINRSDEFLALLNWGWNVDFIKNITSRNIFYDIHYCYAPKWLLLIQTNMKQSGSRSTRSYCSYLMK